LPVTYDKRPVHGFGSQLSICCQNTPAVKILLKSKKHL
jgi:hypothetical protein